MGNRPDSFRRVIIGLAALLALSGCASSIRLDATRFVSQTISPATDCPLKTALSTHIPADKSGFFLLRDGRAALSARLALAQRATHTLDVQYYLFNNDRTGKLMAAALLAAAERGVRVRLLIDDIDSADKDIRLATLNAHPNIQIRLFNPFHTRSSNLLVMGWQALRESVRLNRRMHNKVFIADNQLAITGGRNIGDAYFDAHHDFSFVDLDVLAAGSIIQPLSTSFDQYWNSEAAVPVSALPVAKGDINLLESVQFLQGYYADHKGGESARELAEADPVPALLSGQTPWVIAQADLIADPPEKILNQYKSPSKLLIGQLIGLWVDPTKRALIVSPYFVPRKTGMAYFEYWRSRGVEVSVLTNAYAASDVPIVHAGYANYRIPLLKAGVRLYELKPTSRPKGGRLRDLAKGASRASLHAKTFVFDDEHVFIGSFNLDPRSTLLNTEMGLVIHSPELARQVTDIAQEYMQPERSYQLRLIVERQGKKQVQRLQWQDREGETERVFDVEPDTTLFQRGLLHVLQSLPIEEHL